MVSINIVHIPQWKNMNIEEWDALSVGHVDNLVKKVVKVLEACNLNSIRMIDVGSNVGKFPERLMYHGIVINDAILCDIVPELVDYTSKKFPEFIHLNMAVTDTPNTVQECFNVLRVSDNLGLSRIANNIYGADRDQVIEVNTTTLNSLIDEYAFSPDLVKIDAEGYDIPAVSGLLPALEASENCRPIIVFECAAGTSALDIVQQLSRFGYVTATCTPETSSRDIFAIPAHLMSDVVLEALYDMPYTS